ncbi:hypothetical protein ACHAXT_010848 [Thalassiosira profunda]
MITRAAAAAADANDENARPNDVGRARSHGKLKEAANGHVFPAAIGGRKVARLAARYESAPPAPSNSPLRSRPAKSPRRSRSTNRVDSRTTRKRNEERRPPLGTVPKEGARPSLSLRATESTAKDPCHRAALLSPMMGVQLFVGSSVRESGRAAPAKQPSPAGSARIAACAEPTSRGVPLPLQMGWRLILLLFAMYEVQHYCPLSPAAMVFDVLSELAGWDDVFHAGFVVAFAIRALLASLDGARKHSDKRKEGCRLQTALVYASFACGWMALLPLFRDCGVRFRFFVNRSGEVASPRYSLADVVAREWYRRTNVFIRSKIKGRVTREILRALGRPLAIHSKLKRLFALLRWAKFVGPLVGTCNKFRGHVLDMVKKRRQRTTSRAAQQRWSDLLDALFQQSKLEWATLKLQRRFRQNRASKARRRYALMSQTRTSSNAAMAHQIRRRLVEEQLTSRSKLEKMDQRDSIRQVKRQVSQLERTSITKHRESERRLKKRLLLSPKTSFAVAWRNVTVACVALEMSQIAFAPMLSGELKKMPLDMFLLTVLNASSLCSGDAATKEAPSIFVPAVYSLAEITCSASALRQIWLVATHVLATVLVPVVQAIFFVDVFITFFTGELTAAGTLVPKPLVARYLVPGVGLQLLVNPTMAEVSRKLKQVAAHSMHIGPSLCFHLVLTCAPFAAGCYDCFLDGVIDFVERQNRRTRDSKASPPRPNLLEQQ